VESLLASVDGVIGPAAEAVLPVTDPGLLRGDGVFEVARIYDGHVFAWDEHLQRMARSAANLRLELDLAAVAREVDALVAREPGFDGQVRVLVTRGGRRIAILETLPEHAETIALATITYAPPRILDGVKSLSYAGNMLATRLAKEAGADEALLVTPHGRLLEGPTSSFFFAIGGRLHTPPLDDHVLDSITRRHVVELTGATERVATTEDVASFEEAFLASTTREVQSIEVIEDLQLGPVGERTLQAADLLRQDIAAALTSA
jgi:branched-chain amino acid aminotransferase